MKDKFYDEKLEYKFKVKGYVTGSKAINVDDSLINILESLSDIPDEVEYGRWFCTKKRLVKYAKNILDNYFDLHDVNFIPEKIAHNIEMVLEMGFWDSRMLSNRIEYVSKKISPYEIPINYSYESITNNKIFDDDVYFYSIDIEKRIKQMAIPVYVHELGHTQLDSQRGVITNYHNREVISIFLENLAAIELDNTGFLLRNVLIDRYWGLKACLEFIQGNNNDNMRKLEASVFIVSTLKAENLFDKYISSDNKTKEEILLGIQNVFDGKETVEDFLKRYDVSFKNSKSNKIIRKQLII